MLASILSSASLAPPCSVPPVQDAVNEDFCGIGFYGMCWTGVTGAHQTGGSEIADDNTMSYANIMSGYYSAARYQYDGAAQAPWLGSSTAFGPAAGPKCNFVSYEDPASVAAKGSYVLANHYMETLDFHPISGRDMIRKFGYPECRR